MLKVLFVDDSESFLEMAKAYTERSGELRVLTATSAMEALGVLKDQHIDVIVSDHSIHGISGLELMDRMRLNGIEQPFILLTTLEREEVKVRALQGEIDFCVQKDAMPSLLFAELEHRIKMANQRALERRGLLHRAQMEELIVTISKHLLAARKGQMESEIDRALDLLSEKMGVVRCFTVILAADKHTISQVYEWPPQRQYSIQKGLLGLDLNNYRWHLKKLLDREILVVNDLEQLPPEAEWEKEIWTQMGMSNVTGVPLVMNDEMKGFFGFSFGPADKRMSLDDGNFIRILAEVISAALSKLRYEEALEKSEERFRAIADYTYNWESWIDSQGKVLWVNPAVERLTGYTAEEILAMDQFPRLLVLDEDWEEMVRNFETAASGMRREDIEIRIKNKDGTIRKAALSFLPIFDEKGRNMGIRSSIRDITEAKKVEEALQQADAQLVLINRVTRHEMKGQLRNMRRSLDNIQARTEGEDRHGALEEIESSLRTMEHQIQFMEDYQNLGTMEPLWQDVAEIFEEARMKAETDEISFNVALNDLEVFADPLLEKVFTGLLDHSLSSRAKVSNIALTSKANEQGMTILFEDDGPGLVHLDKERIFMKGAPLNPSRGLFLSKAVLEVTGMTICENGDPGLGTRFEIAVPHGQFRFPRRDMGLGL